MPSNKIRTRSCGSPPPKAERGYDLHPKNVRDEPSLTAGKVRMGALSDQLSYHLRDRPLFVTRPWETLSFGLGQGGMRCITDPSDHAAWEDSGLDSADGAARLECTSLSACRVGFLTDAGLWVCHRTTISSLTSELSCIFFGYLLVVFPRGRWVGIDAKASSPPTVLVIIPTSSPLRLSSFFAASQLLPA
jgi:hypothetical protein